MSQNIEENDLPDRAPSWMLFFEGTLYRRYLNYLNQHDFSQILNNKISLDESFYGGKSFYTDFPSMNGDENDFTDNNFQYEPKKLEAPEVVPITPITTDKFLTKADQRRRIKRTRGFICLGIFCIAAFATAVSLLMHFVYVKDTDPVKDGDVIHIGNGTLNGTELLGNQTDITTNKSSKIPPDFISTNLAGFSEEEHDNIIMSKGPFYIGDKDIKFTCEFTKLENWTNVFIIGNKIHENQSSVLNFNFSRDQETVIINKREKISTRTKTKPDQSEIQLELIYRLIECEDEETFMCGIDNEDGVVSSSTRFNVARKPDSSVNMIVPVEVVSGKIMRISASWNSGYPEPWGNISWSNKMSGSSETSNFNNTKQFWTFKKNREECQITVGSFINFTPSMKDNATEIIAQAILNSDITSANEFTDVIPTATETILVVQENHCSDQGLNNDTLTAHPYTCAKFVRCLPEKMVVFACPTDTCFSEESGQCDYLTGTENKQRIQR